MSSYKLKTENRILIGNVARKLRRDGIIPAVIYSKTQENLNVQISEREFLKVYKLAKRTNVIELELDSKKFTVLVQDLDICPRKGTCRHIDFMSVDLKAQITKEIPVIAIGEAPAVRGFGAVVSQNMNSVEVTCMTSDLPEAILVDLSSLTSVASNIRVSDLVAPNNVTIVSDSDLVVFAVTVETNEETETPETEIAEKVAKEIK
jgi:large subunit ribosomal protein L25